MRILISSIVDLKKCAPNRLHHFINHLSEKHEIRVICINDCWKEEKVNAGKSYKDFDNGLDRIDMVYITKRNINPLYQEFLLSRLIGSKYKDDYDVIFNYNTLLTGNLTAQRNRIPMVYDLADDLPGMVASSPQIPRFLRSTGKMLANRLLAENLLNAKKVTGISKTLQMRYAIPNSKFELVNNGVNTRKFRPLKANLKCEFDLDGFFVLGYVGVLREWVDFKPVYEALKSFRDVRLLIVGEEGLLKENVKLAEAYGITEKVLFTGTVPYASIPEYISTMDCCLIPFDQGEVSQNSVPLKLFEYMACEKPVLSTRLPGVREVVGGRVFYADTAEEYKEQIAHMISSDSESEYLKSNRKFVVCNYDWHSIGQRLEKILDGVKSVMLNITEKSMDLPNK